MNRLITNVGKRVNFFCTLPRLCIRVISSILCSKWGFHSYGTFQSMKRYVLPYFQTLPAELSLQKVKQTTNSIRVLVQLPTTRRALQWPFTWQLIQPVEHISDLTICFVQVSCFGPQSLQANFYFPFSGFPATPLPSVLLCATLRNSFLRKF